MRTKERDRVRESEAGAAQHRIDSRGGGTCDDKGLSHTQPTRASRIGARLSFAHGVQLFSLSLASSYCVLCPESSDAQARRYTKSTVTPVLFSSLTMVSIISDLDPLKSWNVLR